MLSTIKTETTRHRQLISPVLALICLCTMLLLDLFFPLLRVVVFPFNLAGLFVGASGLAICFTAHRQFKRIGTTLYPFNRPLRLVTDGLFRYSRNPMYLGLTVFLAGAWLLLGGLSPLVGVVAFQQVAAHWYIPNEEQRCRAVFGEAYLAYQARTPRWI
jgi:protein-S-isoprenylcysteine O-methyltransferase Ste14